MTTVTVDNSKIGLNKKATVTVSSEDGFDAIEVRGYASDDMARGRGIGVDLLSDDVTTTDGVWEFESVEYEATFDVEAIEFGGGGTYTVVVFTRGMNGWDDTDRLFDKNNKDMRDRNGKCLSVKRASNTSNFSYRSKYSGAEINSFIGEVI